MGRRLLAKAAWHTGHGERHKGNPIPSGCAQAGLTRAHLQTDLYVWWDGLKNEFGLEAQHARLVTRRTQI